MGDATHRSAVPQLVPSFHRAAKPVHKSACGDDVGGGCDHGISLCPAERNRLFDQQVNTSARGLLNLSIMCEGRQGDDQKVKPFTRQHERKIGIGCSLSGRCEGFGPGRVPTATCDQFQLINSKDRIGVPGADPSGAKKAHTQRHEWSPNSRTA